MLRGQITVVPGDEDAAAFHELLRCLARCEPGQGRNIGNIHAALFVLRNGERFPDGFRMRNGYILCDGIFGENVALGDIFPGHIFKGENEELVRVALKHSRVALFVKAPKFFGKGIIL